MASLVKRGNSKVWWIGYRDKNGKRVFESTGYRQDDEKQTQLAFALKAEHTSREYQRKVLTDDELWAVWVPEFLKRHAKGRTHERYSAAWQQLCAFLGETKIDRPRDLTYHHALAFLKWRTAQKRDKGRKTIKLNTALNDMKVLRLVMRQAVRLGYSPGNPCDRLGVAKEEAKEKPEFTDADIGEIRAALVGKPEWMTVCFEIALNTGCRLTETQINFRDIDFVRKSITFANPKGGKTRAFTIPLPTALTPLLTKIKASGATQTVTLPRMAAKHWWEFFGEHFAGKGFCFHATRVTFVTRLHRANVPTSAAMRLVNHSSTLIHRIYSRLGVNDVRQWTDAVQLPPA